MAEMLAPGPMGWVEDRPAIEAYKATLPFQTLMEANPEILAADDDKDIFFFLPERDYLAQLKTNGATIPWKMVGDYLANHHQTTNDCTSHGLSGALEDLQFVRIMWRSVAEEFYPIASEPLYGGAIVTIMGTRGDNGAWTGAPIQYATKYGFLARKNYPEANIDLSNYSGTLAHQWASKGVPSQLLESEKLHLLVTALPIHSYEEGDALLRQGYPVVGGSNQGFSMTRDKDGFCRPQGHWAHCTRYRGRRKGKKPGWAYGQSWGPGMPGGPNKVTLDDGSELTLAEGTFFVDPDTINSMIRQGEFYAISDINGFATLDYKLY